MILENEGNYSLVTGEGNKNQVGTIPSELGQLSLWKHLVFGKVPINLTLNFLNFFVWFMTISSHYYNESEYLRCWNLASGTRKYHCCQDIMVKWVTFTMKKQSSITIDLNNILSNFWHMLSNSCRKHRHFRNYPHPIRTVGVAYHIIVRWGFWTILLPTCFKWNQKVETNEYSLLSWPVGLNQMSGTIPTELANIDGLEDFDIGKIHVF